MTEPESSDFSWREIGVRIRDWRLARGWSQHHLAQAAGLSQSGVVHLEKGDTNPQLSTLRDVASAFSKTLRELMCGTRSALDGYPSEVGDRVRRILDSNDNAALSALEYGIRTGELLLERRSGRAPAGTPGNGDNEAEAAETGFIAEAPPRHPAGARGKKNKS